MCQVKKQFGEYYLGLDVGTSSVGWAVTDLDYNLQKLNGKILWGIRLFNSAKTAEDTRIQRSSRRRLARQKWRISMLQELFAEEISKVDPGFFMRLKESNLFLEDKIAKSKSKYTLFNDGKYTDVEFHEKFPTIYHLRKALINGEKLDVRLVYLAVLHIIKHRGHFLSEGLDASNVRAFVPIYNEMQQSLNENVEGMEEWECSNLKNLEAILADQGMNISEKKKRLEDVIGKDTKQKKALIALLSGGKGKLSDLFPISNETLNDYENNSFTFHGIDYDVARTSLEIVLPEQVEVLDKIKAVYDWSVLISLLGKYSYISDAKIAVYDEHKHDLKVLKEVYKKIGTKAYKRMFNAPKDDKSISYSSYVAHLKDGKEFTGKKCTQEEFCDFLQKEIKSLLKKDLSKMTTLPDKHSDQEELFYRIAQKKAFPKQVIKANGVIPMQIHEVELKKILENAATYLKFLTKVDENKLSVKDKVIQIFEFRIPYYVGPLAGTAMSKEKGRCWVKRKNGRIYPWNFDLLVDKTASAEVFIQKMTNKCSYLVGEDVLPKESLLYSEFMIRNQINNLKLDGTRLNADLCNEIFEHLFVAPEGNRKVTKKVIENHLKKNNIIGELSGFSDDEIKGTLRALKDFRHIFGAEYIEEHKDEIENIIKWITVLPGAEDMLGQKIKSEYPTITAEQLKKIKKLHYSNWGRLSNTFLNSSKISYIDDSTGEVVTIIGAMRKTGLNLMELLSTNCIYDFNARITEFNNFGTTVDTTTYDCVKELLVSPAVKRSIWQTMIIVQEIKKVMGHDPKKIFIEMAREDGEKKRTKSRKTMLLDLYKSCQKEAAEFGVAINKLVKGLDAVSDSQLRSKKLYLYYTQLGRNMYNYKESIDLVELNNNDKWDGDHIFPRSRTKNDSLENLVLVDHQRNMDKGDKYPLSNVIQKENLKFWQMLLDKGLISQGKYDKLVRKSDFTPEELSGFIARQLVETRQSTKAIATMLKDECKTSKIIYSKAENISDFRQEYDFIKCRDVNDLHHAKDAFLNIVVGNVYDVKFTDNPYNFIRSGEKYSLNTKQIYKYDINRNGIFAWHAGETGTLATVSKMMQKNSILYTKMQEIGKGQLYDLTLMRAGYGQVPLKKNKEIAKYGGYNKAGIAYFTLVQSLDKKGKKMLTIESVPIYLANQMTDDDLIDYLTNVIKLKFPKIVYEKIRINSLLEVDGFKLNFTGKSKNDILGISATQLLVNYEEEKYIKELFKVNNRFLKENCFKSAVITKQHNEEMYSLLLKKHESGAYNSRPAGQINVLKDGKIKFIKLDIENQVKVLCEIIRLFICKSCIANLSEIGGSSHAGNIHVSKNVTKKDKLILINQSVTGIFENKVDLLAI